MAVANSPHNVNPRLNAEILAASWSPDGQQMVYTVVRDRSDKTPMDLYLRNEETNEDRKLGSFPLIGRKLSWAPDGKSLIFPQLSGEQATSVFRYWLNDGKLEQLVPAKPGEPVAKGYPRISPDGRTVFYLESSYAITGAKLIRYDVSSGLARSIAVVSHNYDLSPDGEHLVIPAVDSVSKAAAVRIITKDGQPVRDLIRLKPEERILGVTWSPDGKWIYFGRGGDSGPEIHRVAVSGGASTSTGLQTTGWPDIAVHPSGSRIAYLGRGGAELWRVDGLSEALTRLP
jgi:Tol biopolymer transport system component